MLVMGLFSVTMFCVRADVLITRNFEDGLNLCNRNYRCYTAENQVAEEEQTHSTCENGDLYPGWAIVTPGRRQEVAGKSGCDDYKTLEPHTDVDDDGQEERPPDVATQFA